MNLNWLCSIWWEKGEYRQIQSNVTRKCGDIDAMVIDAREVSDRVFIAHNLHVLCLPPTTLFGYPHSNSWCAVIHICVNRSFVSSPQHNSDRVSTNRKTNQITSIMVNCTTSTGNDVDSKMVVSLLFLFLISVFAIFGNGLVCAAFAKNRSLRILTNYYVVSLAVSDILVGAINIPIWMYIRAYK